MTRQIQSAQQPIALEDLGRRTHFSHEDAEALLNIYGMLLGPGTFEEKAGPLCEAVAALAEVERVTIRLADEEVQGLRLVATGGSGIAELMATPVIPYGQGLAGKAFQDGLPVVAADYSSPPAADPTLKDIGQYSVIVWPIKAAGRTTGSLLVGTRKLDHFTPQRIGLLTSILERLGPALENVQLREERLRTEEASLHKMQELAAMFKVANILVQPGSVQEKITDIMRELAEIAEAAWAIYRVPDEKQGGLRWVDLVGSDIVRVTPLLPYGHNIPSIAFHQREAVVANDYASHPLAKRAILDLGVEAFLSVPVMADGATFGVISVAAGHSGHFTEERVKLLTAIIDGLATLLVNSKLTQDLQSSRAEMAVVDEVARIVTSTLKMDEVYQRFASEIGGLMEADQARIGTVDEDNGTLTLTYTSLDAWSPNLVGETIPLAGTFTENIAQSRESLIVDDLKAETRFWTVKGLVQDGMRSSIIVPMVSKDRLIGTLIILSSQPKAYGPREQAILERLALQMAPAVENAQQLQKNQQLALALESIGDGVAFLDNASQVQFVNRSWTNLYGYELNEVRGKHISFVMTDYQGLQDFSADTTKENVIPVWEGEVKRKKKNGEEFDVFLTLTPVTDQSGRVIGRIGISKDITEIKRTAASAKSSLQELEVVDEVAHIVTTTLEIDEVYEQFASELKKLIEFDQAGLSTIDDEAGLVRIRWLSNSTGSLSPRGIEAPVNDSLTGYVASTKTSLIFDNLPENLADEARFTPLRYPDLENMRSLLSVPLVFREQGIGMFFLVSDKTNAFAPREQAILERLATQIAPAVNNAQQFQKMQQLVLALESIGDGVIFLNINGDIQFINRAFADIFAYELDELRGRNISFIARGQEKEVLDRSQEFPTWEGEVGRTRKDGEHIDLYLTLTPVRDQYGRLIGNIGVCKDITETKRTEQRIKETARLSSIGELAAGVAHEINNPLTSVLGFSELILARNPPQDIRKDLEAVFSEANRAAKIVHNLLSFARKGELSMSYMDLPSVLDRALEIKAYEFLVNNINVVRDYAIELPHTLLDEQQIIQIVLNILTNAEQAIRGQQATGQVTVRTSVVDERIRLSISDDGPGIANEDLDKVFDPFFTTKQIGEGTGLGLSMSYGIIHQHGGDIWVESLPGEGATFHIEIPITGPFAESDSPATEKAIVKAHGSVLVVDDEPRILQLMSRLLTVDGVVVDLAGSGEDAWNMLQLLDYDCILLDLRMPDMSGMELYRAVKTKDVELARKVIFMTGDTVGAETRDFIASCANRTLDKPVDLQEVRSLVNEMLAK